MIDYSLFGTYVNGKVLFVGQTHDWKARSPPPAPPPPCELDDYKVNLMQMYNQQCYSETLSHFRPRGYKTFFMLNSAEHEIFSADKYENAN